MFISNNSRTKKYQKQDQSELKTKKNLEKTQAKYKS